MPPSRLADLARAYLAAYPAPPDDAPPQKRDRNTAAAAWLAGQGVVFPFGQIATGVLLDGWLIGSASATAVLNRSDNADTGDWSPGDSEAARDQIGPPTLLGTVGSAAADATSRMTGAYLSAMAVVLTSGAADGLASATLAASLRNTLAHDGNAENAVLNEVAQASADAAEGVYQDAGVSLVDVINGPDPCPECLALAESNPHEPGLVPVHPLCECNEVPHGD